MTLNNTSIYEILSHIEDGEWHSIYSIHERFRLSPSQLIESIRFLESLDAIEEKNREIRLQENINIKTLSALRGIILTRTTNIERSDEARYSSPNISINQLYLPNFKLLDKSLLVDV